MKTPFFQNAAPLTQVPRLIFREHFIIHSHHSFEESIDLLKRFQQQRRVYPTTRLDELYIETDIIHFSVSVWQEGKGTRWLVAEVEREANESGIVVKGYIGKLLTASLLLVLYPTCVFSCLAVYVSTSGGEIFRTIGVLSVGLITVFASLALWTLAKHFSTPPEKRFNSQIINEICGIFEGTQVVQEKKKRG
jgi:hypothetical protein